MERRFSRADDETCIAGFVARGEYAKAEPAARRLLTRIPDHPLGLKALAVAHITAGRHDAAMPLLQRGVSLYPDDAEMHSNLAIALAASGRCREALASIDAALALEPQRAEFHANRAEALLRFGALDAAIESCRAALALAPQLANAHNTLGAALHRKRRFAEALEAFQTAATNNPESLDAFVNFVVTLGDLGRYGEAVICARKVLEEGELAQHEVDALLPHLCAAERACCDWSRTDLPAILRDMIRREVDNGLPPLFMTQVEDIDRATLRHGAKVYGSAYLARSEAVIGQREPPKDAELDSPDRPLRIGFLSGEFRTHPTSELAVGIFEGLDRREFIVHAYGHGPEDSSPLSKRVAAAFDVFRVIDALSSKDAANLIRSDGIDILVDLAGWIQFSRLAILAHSPAPVTATWLGFPGTLGVTGLARYLIGDAVVTPLAHADDYVEHLALMPHCYQPNSRVATDRAAPTRREVGLPEDAFVFCSFNQSNKITPAVFRLWCELLQRNPSAVLWLGIQLEAARDNLRREAQAQGISAARIIFAPWRDLPEHHARLALADLALDTFPYGSHTTGSDMLWAGVPLVARLGDTFAGRVSASVLHAAGVPELIAGSDEEYLALADDLAKDPSRCRALRDRLDATRATAPLFDTRRFGRDLGRLFRAMWQNHVAGHHGTIHLFPGDD